MRRLAFSDAACKMSLNHPTGSHPMNLDAIATAWSPRLLSVLRIMSGLLFLQHGTAKHLKFPVVPMFAKLEPMSLIGAAGAIEIIGSLLLILGLFTRTTAFILSGFMAVAYFMSHVAARLLSDPQWRRARHPLLLRVPLHRRGRPRPVELRRSAEEALTSA
jgi:uncharacterized membrane protein YphA (DoxX/SURF4 family)